MIAQAGLLPLASVSRLAGGLIEALQAVHGRGLVHQDLKPANVLLAADGPRLIDFGISRALEARAMTGTSMIVGTPAFMSPEQAEGLPVGPASDVFALGSVIAFAATGPRHSGPPAQIVTAADGSGYMKDITWPRWGNTTATGTGTLEIDNCVPDCATGTFTGYPATVTSQACRHSAAALPPTPAWRSAHLPPPFPHTPTPAGLCRNPALRLAERRVARRRCWAGMAFHIARVSPGCVACHQG